jgi:hypothetical protein
LNVVPVGSRAPVRAFVTALELAFKKFTVPCANKWPPATNPKATDNKVFMNWVIRDDSNQFPIKGVWLIKLDQIQIRAAWD